MKCLWVHLYFVVVLAAPPNQEITKTLGFLKRNFGLDLKTRERRTTVPDYYNSSNGCRGGKVRNIYGVCEEPIVERRVYVYGLPEIEQERRAPKIRPVGRKQRVDYNLVLINKLRDERKPGDLVYSSPPYTNDYRGIQNYASGATGISADFAYDYNPAEVDYIEYEAIEPFYNPQVYFRRAPIINAPKSNAQYPARISSQRNQFYTRLKPRNRLWQRTSGYVRNRQRPSGFDRNKQRTSGYGRSGQRSSGFGRGSFSSSNYQSGRRKISNFGRQFRKNNHNWESHNSRALKQNTQSRSRAGGPISQGRQFQDINKFNEHVSQQNAINTKVATGKEPEKNLIGNQQLSERDQGNSQLAAVSKKQSTGTPIQNEAIATQSAISQSASIDQSNAVATQSAITQSATIDQSNALSSQASSQDVQSNLQSQQAANIQSGTSQSGKSEARSQTIIGSQGGSTQPSLKRIPGRVEPAVAVQPQSSQVASISNAAVSSTVKEQAAVAEASLSSSSGKSIVDSANIQQQVVADTGSTSSGSEASLSSSSASSKAAKEQGTSLVSETSLSPSSGKSIANSANIQQQVIADVFSASSGSEVSLSSSQATSSNSAVGKATKKQGTSLAAEASLASSSGKSIVDSANLQQQVIADAVSASVGSSNIDALSSQQTQQSASQQSTQSGVTSSVATVNEQSGNSQALVFITTMQGLRSLTANQGAAQLLIQSSAAGSGSASTQGSQTSQSTQEAVSTQTTAGSSKASSAKIGTSQKEQSVQASTLSQGETLSSQAGSGSVKIPNSISPKTSSLSQIEHASISQTIPEVSLTSSNSIQGTEQSQVSSGSSLKETTSGQLEQHQISEISLGTSSKTSGGKVQQQEQQSSHSSSISSSGTSSSSSSTSSSSSSASSSSLGNERGSNSFIRINFGSPQNVPPVNVNLDAVNQGK